MRESFIFYESFLNCLDELEPEVQLEVYRAITHYALKDEEPNLSGVAKAIFHLIKPQIDANNKRYADGKKGGRPKIKTSGFENKKPVVLKNEENKKPNVNVNVNDNVNVNENENDIEKEIKKEKESFDLFYSICPKQKDEYKTFNLFKTLIKEKEVTVDELIEGMKRYKEYTARAGTSERYIKSPLNWLRDKNWADKYEDKEVKDDKSEYNPFALL